MRCVQKFYLGTGRIKSGPIWFSRRKTVEVELGTIQVQFTWKLTGPRAKVESLERERFRTTLLRDHGTWYVMELCEPLDSLIDFTAPFYGHTDNHNRQRKKNSFDDEQPALFEETHHDVVIDIAPENEVVGQEVAIEVAERGGDGAEVPLAGRIVFKPAPTDQLLVNGVELILLAETPPPPPGNSRLPPS